MLDAIEIDTLDGERAWPTANAYVHGAAAREVEITRVLQVRP